MTNDRYTTAMPSNVVYFERLAYLSIALGLPSIFLNWDRIVEIAKRAKPLGGAMFVVLVDGFTLAVLIALVWLTGRRAKNWARWTLLVFFVLGIPAAIRTEAYLHRQLLSAIIGLVQVGLQIVALFLIFTGNARVWFSERPELQSR